VTVFGRYLRKNNLHRQSHERVEKPLWLTGFDAQSLHTLYIDKPMKGHNLMQAIARVNRVYKDKPGGLIVDYLAGFILMIWAYKSAAMRRLMETIMPLPSNTAWRCSKWLTIS
jgi:hypothetical protein